MKRNFIKEKEYNYLPETAQIFPDGPNTVITTAAAVLMLGQIGFAESLIPGILEDTNTEYLHQFRVSFRKIRSLLPLFKNSVPEKKTDIIKTHLKSIQQSTNELRDLDVHLQEEDVFISLTPTKYKKKLHQVFMYYQKKRINELQKINMFLKSDDFKQKFANIKFILLNQTQNRQNKTTAITAARLLLPKQYKNVSRNKCLLNKNVEDQEYHRLRIQCKKLRYLLHFFAGILSIPQKILKIMKKTQKYLGEYNDLVNQITELTNISQTFSSNIHQHILPALITTLTTQKKQKQKNLHKILQKLNKPVMEKFFMNLLHSS